jgi:hypothetical protein
MYVPGRGDRRYNRAWSNVVSDTLYGNLTFYGGEKWYKKATKTRLEITVGISEFAKYSEWLIFLQGNFFVAEVDKAENDITLVYGAGEPQQAPDYNPEMLHWLQRKNVKSIWGEKGIDESLVHFDGCGKYSNISIQSKELAGPTYVRYDDGLLHIAWVIPAWDYAGNIARFIQEHQDAPIDEAADRILETEAFNRTAQYIERIQKKYGKNVELEEIRKEYREFLIDLLSNCYSECP